MSIHIGQTKTRSTKPARGTNSIISVPSYITVKKSGGFTPASSLSTCDAFETKRQAGKPPQNQRRPKDKPWFRMTFSTCLQLFPAAVGIDQCTRITPSSTSKNILDSKDKYEHAASLWLVGAYTVVCSSGRCTCLRIKYRLSFSTMFSYTCKLFVTGIFVTIT
ncbi:hypothetical protein H4582DRAFT_2097266 [Lactarius indigo]|nr:hypothetical protein H4582DRAFT_2097266 [Lactarius indigo]